VPYGGKGQNRDQRGNAYQREGQVKLGHMHPTGDVVSYPSTARAREGGDLGLKGAGFWANRSGPAPTRREVTNSGLKSVPVFGGLCELGPISRKPEPKVTVVRAHRSFCPLTAVFGLFAEPVAFV
jgi:hypothetical protein